MHLILLNSQRGSRTCTFRPPKAVGRPPKAVLAVCSTSICVSVPGQAISPVVFGPKVEFGAVVETEFVIWDENGDVVHVKKIGSESKLWFSEQYFTISCELAFETMIELYGVFPLVQEVMSVR